MRMRVIGVMILVATTAITIIFAMHTKSHGVMMHSMPRILNPAEAGPQEFHVDYREQTTMLEDGIVNGIPLKNFSLSLKGRLYFDKAQAVDNEAVIKGSMNAEEADISVNQQKQSGFAQPINFEIQHSSSGKFLDIKIAEGTSALERNILANLLFYFEVSVSSRAERQIWEAKSKRAQVDVLQNYSITNVRPTKILKKTKSLESSNSPSGFIDLQVGGDGYTLTYDDEGLLRLEGAETITTRLQGKDFSTEQTSLLAKRLAHYNAANPITFNTAMTSIHMDLRTDAQKLASKQQSAAATLGDDTSTSLRNQLDEWQHTKAEARSITGTANLIAKFAALFTLDMSKAHDYLEALSNENPNHLNVTIPLLGLMDVGTEAAQALAIEAMSNRIAVHGVSYALPLLRSFAGLALPSEATLDFFEKLSRSSDPTFAWNATLIYSALYREDSSVHEKHFAKFFVSNGYKIEAMLAHPDKNTLKAANAAFTVLGNTGNSILTSYAQRSLTNGSLDADTLTLAIDSLRNVKTTEAQTLMLHEAINSPYEQVRATVSLSLRGRTLNLSEVSQVRAAFNNEKSANVRLQFIGLMANNREYLPQLIPLLREVIAVDTSASVRQFATQILTAAGEQA